MEKLKRLLAAIDLKHFNLKWVKHALWIVALTGLFVYLNVAPPFLAVASQSMEPVLSRGDLIFSGNAAPGQIQAGDVIVFKVSPVFQEKYGYPDTICHRVVRIQSSENKLYFRTKGDNNASDDPFMTPADNLVGLEKSSVPVVGYLVMFAQSSQGKYFLAGLVILFLLYSNSARFLSGAKKVRTSIAGISTTEFTRSQNDIEKKMGQMTDQVVQSMNGFSTAMSEYAQHIASHTGAIKSLAAAAQHMESILEKQDTALSQRAPPVVVQKLPESNPALPAIQTAIEITPELKMAVKEFIIAYNIEHDITSVEITPELRSAVWNFIQEYVKNPSLPEPGAYASAIKTVKITPELDEMESEEAEDISLVK
jgi:signal peptidase